MRSGTRSDRKAREVARSPACGLAVSLRGRGSISKGDLFWIGSRADMPRHRHIIYNKSKQINAPTQDYFPISENYAAIRGDGGSGVSASRPKAPKGQPGRGR